MSDAPAPGWYQDERGARRWWDGAAWGPGAGAALVPGRISDAERRAILDHAVTRYVEHGYRVESNTGAQAVVGKRQRVHVLLNVGLAIVTGGLWLVVLAIRLLNWPVDRAVISVDERGLVTGQFS